jgi:heme iron utilization protein
MDRQEQVPVRTQRGSAIVPERLKVLGETERFAVLATDAGGQPYTSLVSFALTPDIGVCLFATPRETQKYRNILHGNQVALLVDNRHGSARNLMETEAITIIGKARAVRKGKGWESLAAVYLAKHPDLEGFLRSPSTALIAVKLSQCIHVGGFQMVSTWDCQK